MSDSASLGSAIATLKPRWGWCLALGIALLIAGFGRALLWTVIGALYVFGGVFAMVNPLLASAVLTLILGAALIVAGIMRIILGTHLKAGQHGGLIILSGVFTLLFGVIILLQWPFSSLYVLGLILGVDLIQAGIGWINLGLFLKRAA